MSPSNKYTPIHDEEENIEDSTEKFTKKRFQCRSSFWLPRLFGALFVLCILGFLVLTFVPKPRIPKPYVDVEPEVDIVEDIAKRHEIFTSREAGLSLTKIKESNEEFLEKYQLSKQPRFRTHILLDKPVYRPGETVRGAGFAFHSFGSELDWSKYAFNGGATVIVKDAKDVEISRDYIGTYMVSSNVPKGIFEIQWKVPKDIAGGEFTIILEPNSYSSSIFSKSIRKFEVRATRSSQVKINKKLEFEREGYSKGDVVRATLSVDNKEASDLSAIFIATVDSMIVFESSPITISNGEAVIEFPLPSEMKSGEGVLVAKLSSGALRESVSKTIPIVTQKLDIGVFPEGGVLDDDTLQRIYVEAIDSVSAKPVDFKAGIFTNIDHSIPLTIVSSVHEGRGVSETIKIPKGVRSVYLQILSPSSVSGQTVNIPLRIQPLSSMATISTGSAGSVFRDSLVVDVIVKAGRTFRLELSRLEKSLYSQIVDGTSKVVFKFDPKDKTHGVLRLTLFDQLNVPIAERLVFRLPENEIEFEIGASIVEDIEKLQNVKISSNSLENVEPADGIAVSVKSWMRNVDPETGELVGERVPIKSTMFLRVTDSALPSTIEERLLPPRLTAAVFLETEVDRLENTAHFLPRSSWGWQDDNPKKTITYSKNLDLLLGTQGWRRFAYFDMHGFATTGKVPIDSVTFQPIALRNQASSKSAVGKIAIESMLVWEPQKYQPNREGFPIMYAAGGGMRMNNKAMFMKAAAPPQNEEVMDMAMPEVMAMAAAAPEDVNGADDAEAAEVVEEMIDEDDRPVLPANENEQGEADIAMEEKPVMEKRPAMKKMAPDEDARMDVRAFPPQWTRVYAHPQRKYVKAEFEKGVQRSDFTETVYSHSSLSTSCEKKDICEAIVSFGLSDASSATFVVHVDGISSSGPIAVGAAHMKIKTSSPLEVDFNMPSVVVAGDRPKIPISVSASSSQGKFPLEMELSTNILQGESKRIQIEGNSRIYMELDSAEGTVREDQEFTLRVSAGQRPGQFDAVKRSSLLIASGFPTQQYFSGLLKREKADHVLKLPKDVIVGSLDVSVLAFTSPVGKITKALEKLIRAPCGCFEQTSSTTYPLVFVLQYLKSHTGSNPSMIQKAYDMLKQGYDRLVSYETSTGGFEWFGSSPGHEALTAYGLLQFAAMADPLTGLNVDKKMIQRTKKWMESRRDGQGGFLRNERALDSFGAAPKATTDAYITWALVRAGLIESREKEIQILVDAVMDPSNPSSGDGYIVALAALSLFDATQPTTEQLSIAHQLADKLARMQDASTGGFPKNSFDSITRSRGISLELETTALAILVWLHDDKYNVHSRIGIEFIAKSCEEGRFGSTQATALSIMAIVEYDKKFSKPLPKGSVDLLLDGKVVESIQIEKSSKPKSPSRCIGDLVWNECGSLCTPTCGNPNPVCIESCEPTCSCPPETPIKLSEGKCGTITDCKDSKPLKCPGDTVWSDCMGCPSICGEEPKACALMCGQGCTCPPEKPFLNSKGDCVVECEQDNSSGTLSFSASKILSEMQYKKGSHHKFGIRISSEDEDVDGIIPYSFAFKYSVVTPKRSETNSPVLTLSTKLEQNILKEGDVGTIRVLIENISTKDGEDSPLPMVVAIIGIPGGCEPRTDQLKELKSSKLIDFVESKPGQVILYWRALRPKASLSIPIQFTAAIPGTFVSPSSRAYLFYNDEDKYWSEGYSVEIKPLDGGIAWGR